MSTPTTRNGTARDVDGVLDLWRAAGVEQGVSDTREGLLLLLDRDPSALLVAEASGLIVASLIAAWDGWRGSFYRVTVHPDHRRRGVARRLLREGEKRLRARGAARLTAIVAHDDPAAIAFWQDAGYVRQPDRARFIRHTEN